MGKTVGVDDKNVHHLINQAYLSGGPYQWAREGLVNSLQANATKVVFGIEEQGFTSRGVARRYIADNGHGMSPDELRLFLSSFGGGGRTIGIGANFGQGFKASCYEWNPYGILVVSWTAETPEGRMIWINRDVRHGNTYWELRDFQIDDGSGGGTVQVADQIIPCYLDELGLDAAALKTADIEEAGHGTVFLFLGDSPERNTDRGDYLRGEDNIRGIVRYLNTRFLNVDTNAQGDPVEVRVTSLEAKAAQDTTERRDNKDNFLTAPNGKRQTLHSRRVRGALTFIPDGSLSGSMTTKHDTRIDWYLAPDAADDRDTSYGPTKPSIVVSYEGEAYNSKSDARTYRLFGISDEVKRRLWLVITPPKMVEGSTAWGVYPQASRGMLLSKGSQELPMDDWQNHFADNLPKPIRDAIRDSKPEGSEEESKSRKERLKRVAVRLGTRWRPVVLTQSRTGRQPGDPAAPGTTPRSTNATRASASRGSRPGGGSANTGGAGKSVILNPNAAGAAFGAEQRKSEGIPDVDWKTPFQDGEEVFAARFDPKQSLDGSFGTVYLNSDWPMFQQEMRYWQDEYPRADYYLLETVVRNAYEDEVVSKVLHAHRLLGSTVGQDEYGDPVLLKQEHVEEMISPASLTAAVIGLTNVESKIRTACGSKFGPALSAKAKSPKSSKGRRGVEGADLPY